MIGSSIFNPRWDYGLLRSRDGRCAGEPRLEIGERDTGRDLLEKPLFAHDFADLTFRGAVEERSAFEILELVGVLLRPGISSCATRSAVRFILCEHCLLAIDGGFAWVASAFVFLFVLQ